MLKKCTFSILFTMLAMAGVANAATHTSTTPNQDDKGCYLISDADELYGFAKLVNAGNATACGKLDADIVVNTNVLGTNNANVNELGQLSSKSTPTYPWTPIGTSGTPFHGSFDGQGHTISGLYFYDMSENFGLFGYIGGNNIDVTIKDLNISDSYFGGNVCVGSLVGHIVAGGKLTIENVSSGAAVYSHYSSGTGYIGGLIGYVESENGLNLSITGTHNEGLVIGYDYKGSVHNYIGGLVGGTSGLVSVTVANSFNTGNITGSSYVGGLIGGVKNPTSNAGITLNITNAYNTGTINGSSRNNIGGLVGRIEVDYSESSVEIRNCYNYGSVDGFAITNTSTTTLGQISFTPINCYYLAEESNGFGMSANDFADGTVFALLRSGEDGEVWYQYDGDVYPDFTQDQGKTVIPAHVATLHYSENEIEKIPYVEGEAKALPSTHQYTDATIFQGWFNNQNFTGDAATEIPADANTNLNFYAKTKTIPVVDGCYQISDADMLYKFADMVNNQNYTYGSACAKLTQNIRVNENVLTDAMGVVKVDKSGAYTGADSASFRKWTPIGTSDNPFKGSFNGQGHTISGLYFNDSSVDNVGLFGYVESRSGNVEVSIKNVGLEDSYFKAGRNVGGIVGLVGDNVDVKIENVYNAAAVTDGGSGNVGGIVGEFWTYEPSTLNILNSYNSGAVFGNNSVGGLVGDVDDRTSASTVSIKNSYNYGAVTAFDDQGETLVGSVAGTSVNISDTYYLKNSALQSTHGGTEMSSTEFADGTVYAALHSAEGGEDWRQYAGDDYPTLAAKTGTGAPAPMHVAVLHYSETDSVVIAYTEGSAFTLPATLPDGSIVVGDWYKSNSLSGDAYTKIAVTENGDLNFYAKAMKLDSDGYYEVADADMLFKFADLVNNENSTYGDAKAKLTADIVVNKHVLADANGVSKVNSDGAYIGADSASFHKWIPIGSSNGNPFKGSFDGQGHVISGLYINEPVLQGYNYNALFGAVGGESVTIKNVGVEDSYFSGQRYVSGLVGGSFSDTLKIENSYSAATLHGINGLGGLVGEVSNGKYKLSIENSYSFGTIKYDTSSGGLPAVTGALVGGGAKITEVHNSYYLVQEGVESKYGSAATSIAFEDGTVAALLHGEGVSADSLWGQNVSGGDTHPNFYKGVNVENGPGVITGGPATSMVVLHFLDGSDTSFTYVEGWGKSLPEKDKDGKYVIWYDEGGTSYIDIPSTVNGDLNLHAVEFKPGSDGVYEIANVATLYKFAAIVNGGNFTAKAKLMNDIVVNENVLATAGGVSNVDATTGNYIGSTTGLREWTPIGYYTGTWDCPAKFQGSFDGQGHTISGLYYNDKNSYDAGLFGYIGGTQSEVSIQNVGVEDSYFKAGQFAGGILGRADENTDVKVENVSNASVAVAPAAGGIVGRIYGKDFDMTNAYNVGSAFGTNAGGLVGEIYSDKSTIINNSYSYGPFKDGAGALIGSVSGGPSPSVTNSYYLASEQVGDYGTNKSAADFENGTVLAALRAGEGGYVWVQAEGDKYPTIDINASKNANTIVLNWASADDSTTLVAAGYTDSAMVIVKDGKKFYANGAIYEGILSADQVTAIGDNMLHPVSGIELATVNNELVATVNGDSDEPLMIPTDVEVSEVVYERVLTKGVYATIMVPFSVPVSSVNGFSFYKFKRVGQTNEGKWAVYVSTVKDSLRANTPYIIVASNNATQITFKLDDYLTLNTTSDVYETTNGNWTMKGVYERKDFLKGDPELGKAYGFAGDTTQVNTRIGRFVRAGDSSYVLPMGVYLVYEEPKMLARPGQMGSSFARINVMPENISVEIEDEEETTVVKHITVAPTFVKSSDRWFDMKGRSLGEKPTAKGTYYHNGQRVIIK